MHHVSCLGILIVKDKLLALIAQVDHQFRVARLPCEVDETQDVNAGISKALVLYQELGEGASVVVGRVFDERDQQLANVVEICDPLHVKKLVGHKAELPAELLVQVERQGLGRGQHSHDEGDYESRSMVGEPRLLKV